MEEMKLWRIARIHLPPLEDLHRLLTISAVAFKNAFVFMELSFCMACLLRILALCSGGAV